MYPLSEGHRYLKNSWYVAALAGELDKVDSVSGERPIVSRRILDELVILYRTENGEAVALSGICPHRRMPLDRGRLVGDRIQCGYHGITFGADGQCVLVPSQPRPTEALQLRRYPTVERWQFIWIWTGDAEAADPSLIPDHQEMGLGKGWAASPPEHYLVPSRFQLMVENLLDLSHISFLHGSFIEDEAWTSTPVTITKQDDRLVASRHAADSARSSFHEWMFGELPKRVDQDLRTVFFGPAICISGPTVRKLPEDGTTPGQYLGTMIAVHAITPETAHSSHYFSTTTRDFRLNDQAMTDDLHKMDIAVRMQDVVALGAIERELSSGAPLPREVSVQADTPALHVRRLVDDMIAEEIRLYL